MKVLITLEEGQDLPIYQTAGAVGIDLTVNKIIKVFKGEKEVTDDKLQKVKDSFRNRGYIKIRAFERVLFGTGMRVSMPLNMEMQIRSRSGMALKQGLIVANQPGTIDPDYRGEIGVILFNSTPYLATVNQGDRVAQAVFNEVIKPELYHVATLEDTVRGEGGFGSTNK